MPEIDKLLTQIHLEIDALRKNLSYLSSVKDELNQAKTLVSEHIEKINNLLTNSVNDFKNLQETFLTIATEIKNHTNQEVSQAVSSLEKATSEIGALTQEAKELFRIVFELPRRFDELKSNIQSFFPQLHDLFELNKEVLRQIQSMQQVLEDNFTDVTKRFTAKILNLEEKFDENFSSLNSEIQVLHESNSELKKQNKLLQNILLGTAVLSLTSLCVLLFSLF